LFLQLLFSEAGPTAITAPGIRQDQQVLGRAMQRLADRRPQQAITSTANWGVSAEAPT
jgi:hypothetical protein